MHTQLKVSQEVQDIFRCPACRTDLELVSDQFVCNNTECKKRFPIVDGIPVLINESSSVFSIDDFVHRRNTTINLNRGRFERFVRRITPRISKNIRE